MTIPRAVSSARMASSGVAARFLWLAALRSSTRSSLVFGGSVAHDAIFGWPTSQPRVGLSGVGTFVLCSFKSASTSSAAESASVTARRACPRRACPQLSRMSKWACDRSAPRLVCPPRLKKRRVRHPAWPRARDGGVQVLIAPHFTPAPEALEPAADTVERGLERRSSRRTRWSVLADLIEIRHGVCWYPELAADRLNDRARPRLIGPVALHSAPPKRLIRRVGSPSSYSVKVALDGEREGRAMSASRRPISGGGAQNVPLCRRSPLESSCQDIPLSHRKVAGRCQ